MDINRKTAYKVLLRMEQTDAYSNIELNAQLKQEQPDSPGFVRELVYGVTERRLYLDFFLSQLVSRGLEHEGSATDCIKDGTLPAHVHGFCS